MKTKGVRIYGKNDLRLEEFELPPIKEDEVLMHIISDSICMSSYKVAIQGADHKRVPADVAENPTLIGHEFCGEIIEVGKKWEGKYQKGQKATIQPALNYKGRPDAPGYSYQYCGGNATFVILPQEVMELDCLLKYDGPGYFTASLAEPMSCIISGFHAAYHTTPGVYEHKMGIVEGGNMAILAGVGPMGLGAIDYAIHCDRKPGLLVVTDIDEQRLQRAQTIHTVKEAEKNGVKLIYVNTKEMQEPEKELINLTDGKGYDDVIVFAPVPPVIEQGDKILGNDGCMNFFAGPTKTDFTARVNFYNVHYAATHIMGTTGASTDDTREALEMMGKGLINPSAMVTHIGGLDTAAETTLNLPNIPGGKKLIYPNISMPLTAISDFEEKAKDNPMFAKLAEITKGNNGLWCIEAEDYLLENAEKI